MSSSIITKPLSEKIYAVRTRLGIWSFAHPSFAQIAQDRWANVTNSLRSLRTNEQLWGNRSGHSWKMSKCEQFAQVAQEKWANEQITRFFEQSLNFLFCSQKISDLLKKNWKTCIFCMFLQFFGSFLKKQTIRSFLLSEVSKLLRSLRTNEQPWVICSGAQKEWLISRESLRSLTKNERMS